MGVFSWNCECCGQSVKSPFSEKSCTPPQAIAWQNEVVALLPDGTQLRGYYDGYGRVNADPSPWPLDLEGDSLLVQKTGPWDNTQRKQKGDPAVWHARCYAHAGSPTEYPGPSHPADDQGHFYSLGKEVQRAEKFWNETTTTTPGVTTMRIDTNNDRAIRARKALDAYLSEQMVRYSYLTEAVCPASIADLLCDLQHLADSLGADWVYITKRGEQLAKAARYDAQVETTTTQE